MMNKPIDNVLILMVEQLVGCMWSYADELDRSLCRDSMIATRRRSAAKYVNFGAKICSRR